MSRLWMPLYVGDYIKDTRRLSTIEHGAYLLLIMEYWTHGGLPDDDKRLARIAGLSAEEWADARENIAALFLPGWKHKRIDAEIEKAAARSDKARDKANKRWQADGNAEEKPQHMPQHSRGICRSDASHSHSHREDTNVSSQERASARELAARDAFDRVRKAYPRRQGRDPNDTARKSLTKAIAAGATVEDIEAGALAFAKFRQGDDPRFTPMLATWLNQRGWLDDYTGPPPRDGPAPRMSNLAKIAMGTFFDDDRTDSHHAAPAEPAIPRNGSASGEIQERPGENRGAVVDLRATGSGWR